MGTNDKKLKEFRQREKRKKLKHWFQNLLLTFFVLLFGFPIYWIFIGAFKEKGEFFHYPPIFWVTHFKFDNFIRALSMGGSKGTLDSLIVACIGTVLVVILALFAGYGLGRFKFGGPNLSFFVLSLLFAPPIIAVLPLFNIFRYLRIVDTYFALIWSYFFDQLTLCYMAY